MRAGQLRDLVRLQKPHSVIRDDGERIDAWADVAEVWAKVWDLRGREYLMSREDHADMTTKVTIRYRDDVTRAWRIRFGDRTLDIVHVINLQARRQMLELMCHEVIG